MKNYYYIAKSHCEAPDIESTISQKELKQKGCPIRYTDDADDTIGYRCGGKVIENKCQSCGVLFSQIDALVDF